MNAQPVAVLRRFLPLFLPMVVVVAVGVFLDLRTRDLAYRREVALDNEVFLRFETQRLASGLGAAAADAVLLSELAVQDVGSRTVADGFQGHLTGEFSAFLRSRVAFDRVAYLDSLGKELLRVDRTPSGVETVADAELEDHGAHGHFQTAASFETLAWLSSTEVRGAGAEETNARLHLLLIVRKVPSEGAGFVLLRFSLLAFLEGLRASEPLGGDPLLLATRSGAWLLPPTTSDGSAGAVQGTARDYLPDTWPQIPSMGSGTVRGPSGLLSYATLDPAQGARSMHIPGIAVDAEEDWLLLSFAPRGILVADGRSVIIGLGALFLVALGFLVWGWTAARVGRETVQRSLREREEFLGAATRAVKDALIVSDSAGRVSQWNSGAEEMFGYTEAEMLGVDLHSTITPPELRDAAAAGLRTFARTGQGAALGKVLELPALRRDGTRFSVELSLATFSVGEGQFCVGIVRDITERKVAQERLGLSDQILHAIGDMVLVADAEGAIVFASPSVEQVLGWGPSEVLGEGWWEVAYPEAVEREAIRKAATERARGEEAPDSEGYDRTIRHRDGSVRWVRWREFTGPGSTVIGIGADVTERKEAEDARRRLGALVRNSPDFVGYAGLDGMCEFVNPGGLAMVGLDDSAEACQRSIFEFIHPEDLDLFRSNILARVERGESWEGELRLLHHGGGEAVPVQGGIFPVLSEEGGTRVAIGGTFTNLQVRKELENALVKTAARAEAANEAKQRFLANMSHEIRTPMNAIIGMAELLWDTPLSSEQRDYVQVFRAAGEALLTLINDVLDLSKVEEGRLTLEEVGFDLRELLEHTVETFGAVAHGKGLEIGARVDPAVPAWAMGDPGRLRQVLSNLIGNAVKFTERGSILASVNQEGDASAGEVRLRFSVTDSGMGIPPEKLGDVFGRFTQADSSTTRRFGGSGLGLAISSGLVELMGGRLQVESTEGVGSTFFFVVTLKATDAPDSQKHEAADFLSVRTLVVDDIAINRLILREILTTWGALVDEAPGVAAALTILEDRQSQGHPIRLCLLDAEMPGVDGYDLARSIRDNPELGRPKVIMLTSHGEGRTKEFQAALGLSGHMTKPVRRPTLLHAITRALERTAPEARTTATPAVPPVEEASDGGTASRPFRILVVDDSSDNRMLLKAYLKKTPHLVDFAEDGGTALAACTAQPFDLVFMDIQMPVMDGYQATRAIRARECETGSRPARIVALSAHVMKEEVQMSLDAGCDDHLTKPIKKARIFEAIAEAQALRSAQPESVGTEAGP